MADHGAIGTYRGGGRLSYVVLTAWSSVSGAAAEASFSVAGLNVRHLPEGSVDPVHPDALQIDVLGTLSGIVTDTGVPVPYTMVALYLRSTNVLMARVRTDAAGEFTFTNVDRTNTEGYYVVAFDPAGGTSYNAKVLDKLSPV